MEVTGNKRNQVHVLRQTFRPNEPFKSALSELVTTGPNGPRPFTIYSSDELHISMPEVGGSELAIQHIEAKKFLETKQNTHLELQEPIQGRIARALDTGGVVLQLVMKPVDTKEYSHILHGLDAVRLGKFTRAIGFEALQLYINVPIRQILPISLVKKGLAEINEILNDERTRHRYQITPVPYLVGQNIALPNSMPQSDSPPKVSAS